MPTYDYECQACGHRFEAFQSITEGALRKCRECGRLKLKRLIGTGGGVLFKGSGFYETDYRSQSYRDQQKKESSSGSSKKADKKDSGGSSSDSKKGSSGGSSGSDSSTS